MKLLEKECTESDPLVCADRILETTPLVMRVIRSEIRSRRPADLSVPQFRVLAFLKRHPGAGVSAIAEHIGITMPTASKLIDGLVNRELIAREASPEDRRRVSLKVTKAGESAWKASRRDLQPKIAGMLANLSPEDIAAISRAMEVLRSVFGQEQDTNGHC